MRRIWTLSGLLASVGSLSVAALALGARLTPAACPAFATPTLSAMLMAQVGSARAVRGAGSCAASSCHGGAAPLDPRLSAVLRNEHSTWITSDPHASAFEVLSSERSQSIARNLGKKANLVIPPDQDSRCLACHATPTPPSTDPSLAEAVRRDGVSCESCHGASADWVGEHTRFDWAGLAAGVKQERFGYQNLHDPASRAKVCSGCHVGAPADPSRGLPARDVNHDLIAAGHPRLNWEFSAYVANYPKHWVQKDRTPDWDARLWKVGQIATLAASMDLLKDRAEKVEAKNAPWPELAEYSCFSCHFALQDKPFRVAGAKGAKLGLPAWASWHLPMVEELAKTDPSLAGIETKLNALRDAMSDMADNPGEVASQAGSLKNDLETWLASSGASRFDAGSASAMIEALKEAKPTGWDSAAQRYLGLAAVHASQGQLSASGRDPALTAELQDLVKRLAFPEGYDGPRGFVPTDVNRQP